MKNKLILIAVILYTINSNSIIAQNKTYPKAIIDTIECVIGSETKLTINYDHASPTINAKDTKIGIYTDSDQKNSLPDLNLKNGYSYFCKDGDYNGIPKGVQVRRIKYIWNNKNSAPIYYLKVDSNVPNIVGDFGPRNRIWVIKPKYPVLTPILEDTIYCGNTASFNFAALGLDNDILYSYEIDTAANKVATGKGSIVVLDSLINGLSYFNHLITIKGYYNENPFYYKEYKNYEITGKKDTVQPSIWKTFIRGPIPPDLIKDYEWSADKKILYLKFKYMVGKRPYIPDIKYDFKVTQEILENDKKTVVFVESKIEPNDKDWAKIRIESSAITTTEGEPVKLAVKFIDQFNSNWKDPLAKDFEIRD